MQVATQCTHGREIRGKGREERRQALQGRQRRQERDASRYLRASSGHQELEDDDVGHGDRDYELFLSRCLIGSAILYVDQHRHLLTNSH